MATKRKLNPAIMAALAARAQGAGAGPVAGAPGGAPDAGIPGGAPAGGMPGGPAGMKRGGGVKRMADGGGAGQGTRGVPAKPSVGEQEMVQDAKDAKDRAKIAAMGYARGGKVGSASSRGDGIAQRGKTVGKYC